MALVNASRDFWLHKKMPVTPLSGRIAIAAGRRNGIAALAFELHDDNGTEKLGFKVLLLAYFARKIDLKELLSSRIG